MEKRKTAEVDFLQAAEWVRRLAEETAAFEVAKVVEAQTERGERRPMEWDYVITLSVKPDHRRVDLFVQTRQQLSPATVLGVFPRLRWVPPDSVLLVCAPYISPRVAELCREQNVCYLDGVGNCRIAAPGLFVHVSGRPNRPASAKATIDPFSRKSSRVVGSLDVDLALDAQKLKPKAYESIRKKLVDAGYQQSPEIADRFFRSIKGTPFQVRVDLITGEFSDVAVGGSHLLIQELAVWKARGVDLAFAFQQVVSVEGVLPDGGHNRVTAPAEHGR